MKMIVGYFTLCVDSFLYKIGNEIIYFCLKNNFEDFLLEQKFKNKLEVFISKPLHDPHDHCLLHQHRITHCLSCSFLQFYPLSGTLI